MTRPITPDEVVTAKANYLPEEVFTVVNDHIAKHWNGHSATIKQDMLADEIAYTLDITRQEVFARKFLDFEEVYRQAGWKVKYDKPGYNEDYDAYFEFRRAT